MNEKENEEEEEARVRDELYAWLKTKVAPDEAENNITITVEQLLKCGVQSVEELAEVDPSVDVLNAMGIPPDMSVRIMEENERMAGDETKQQSIEGAKGDEEARVRDELYTWLKTKVVPDEAENNITITVEQLLKCGVQSVEELVEVDPSVDVLNAMGIPPDMSVRIMEENERMVGDETNQQSIEGAKGDEEARVRDELYTWLKTKVVPDETENDITITVEQLLKCGVQSVEELAEVDPSVDVLNAMGIPRDMSVRIMEENERMVGNEIKQQPEEEAKEEAEETRVRDELYTWLKTKVVPDEAENNITNTLKQLLKCGVQSVEELAEVDPSVEVLNALGPPDMSVLIVEENDKLAGDEQPNEGSKGDEEVGVRDELYTWLKTKAALDKNEADNTNSPKQLLKYGVQSVEELAEVDSSVDVLNAMGIPPGMSVNIVEENDKTSHEDSYEKTDSLPSDKVAIGTTQDNCHSPYTSYGLPQGSNLLSNVLKTPNNIDIITEDVFLTRSICSLVRLLREGNEEGKAKAARELKNCCADDYPRNDLCRDIIVQRGGVAPLVKLLQQGSVEGKEMAAGALSYLAVNEYHQETVVNEGALRPLIELANDGTAEGKLQASWALANLATNPDVSIQMASEEDTIPALISLTGQSDADTKLKAASALRLMAINQDISVRIVVAGGLTPLVTMMGDANEKCKVEAVEALLALVVNESNREKIAVERNCVSALISLLSAECYQCQVHSCGILFKLSAHNDTFKEMIANENGILPLIDILKSEETNNRESIKACENALLVLQSLAVNKVSSTAIVSNGGIIRIVDRLNCGSTREMILAAKTLSNLAVSNISNQDLILTGNCIVIVQMVKLLKDHNPSGQISAARTLKTLVQNSNFDEAVSDKQNCIGALLHLLRSDMADVNLAGIAALSSFAVVKGKVYQSQMLSKGCGDLLVVLLRKYGEGGNVQLYATWLLRILLSNASNHVELGTDGVITSLVKVAAKGHAAGYHAAAALKHLASSNKEYSVHIAKLGGIEPLINLMCSGETAGIIQAAGALKSLANNDINKLSIAEKGGIPPLVRLLSHVTSEVKVVSAGALSRLAAHDDNHKLITNEGAIPYLSTMVCGGKMKEKIEAAAALKYLSKSTDSQEMIANQGCIPHLIELLRKGNEDGQTDAAWTLWNLALNADVRKKIAKENGIYNLIALLSEGCQVSRTEAAGALKHLSRFKENQIEIAEKGGILPLIALLFVGNDEGKIQAVVTLKNLARIEENQVKIRILGGIPRLVSVLSFKDEDARTWAAAALKNLARNEENRNFIAEAGGIVPLVELVTSGTAVGKFYAARALLNLAKYEDNRIKIRKAGGIGALIKLARDGDKDGRGRAAWALKNLAQNAENKVLIANGGGITPLITIIKEGCREGKAHAAGALAILAHENEMNQVMIARGGGIAPLIKVVEKCSAEGQIEATVALMHLSCNEANRDEIFERGGLSPIMGLLKEGSTEAKQWAAGALKKLSVNSNCRNVIGDSCVKDLIKLLQEGTPASKSHAVATLSNLVADNDITINTILKENGISCLIDFLCGGDTEGRMSAASALFHIVNRSVGSIQLFPAKGLENVKKVYDTEVHNETKEKLGSVLEMLS